MILYTDQIKHIIITRDKFGSLTEDVSVTYDCIIEYNRIQNNNIAI